LSFAQRQELEFDRGHDSYEARTLDAVAADLKTPLIAAYVEATGATRVDHLIHARGLESDGFAWPSATA
jgi:hypothetical protein